MNARQMTIGCKLRRTQLLQPAATSRPDEMEAEANASVPSVRENRGLNPQVAKPASITTRSRVSLA
jgi:hypothetical protein